MSKLEPTRTYSNPTATEVLRRLLDERGVEHYDGTERTLWGYEQTGEDTGIYRFAASEISGGFLQFDMFRITPAQAIAATLGTGTCHVENSIIDTYEYNRWEYELSCGHTIIWEDSEPPNYCPECGARVVEPTTNDVDVEVDDG